MPDPRAQLSPQLLLVGIVTIFLRMTFNTVDGRRGIYMLTVYNLKPGFQKLLRPMIIKLHAMKITPNQITLIALVGSVIIGLLIWRIGLNGLWPLILPIWLFIRMALNALDGMMAREFNMQGRLGCILNEVGDVVSDVALYLPLAIVVPLALWPIIFFVLGAILTEFCGLLAQTMGGKRHYEGPMGKSDRAFLVGALVIISVLKSSFIIYWGWIFWVAAALTVWTCLNRVLAFLKGA